MPSRPKECKECRRQYTVQKYSKNREIELARSSAWQLENKEAANARKKEWADKNKFKVHTAQMSWRARNHETHRSRVNSYRKKKAAQDPCFRLVSRVRGRINHALRGTKKVRPSGLLLGCSPEEFKSHIESLWLPGMSWDNYGLFGWHIDHKKPCCAFDLTDPEQQRQCFHYTNLQPLWAEDNLRKGGLFLSQTYKK